RLPTKKIVIAVVMAVLATVIATQTSWTTKHLTAKSAASPPAYIRSQYIRRANYPVVIVFVGSVFGDSTWMNRRTHAFWPKLVAEDAVLENTDIYVHSYASFTEVGYSLDELSDQLYESLVDDQVFQAHDQIVFLCHSLG